MSMDEHTRACLQAILDGKQMQLLTSGGWCDFDAITVLRRMGLGGRELNNVRIKPEPMCELAGVQYPMPMQEAPKVDTAYWLAKSNGNGPDCEEWQGLEIERQWLAANICHATKEAAEAHSKAMLAVNAQAVAKAKEQA